MLSDPEIPLLRVSAKQSPRVYRQSELGGQEAAQGC